MCAARDRGKILDEIVERARVALQLCAQAHAYAAAAEVDHWQFAVELAVLRAAGLNHNDLRWLIRYGYAEHRLETTTPACPERRFHRPTNLAFAERSCCMLTKAGEAALANLPLPEIRRRLPHWDSTRRELWLGEHIVKSFRQPAHAQEVILAAFEEEGWPPMIDDPLPRIDGQDAKARLRVTIQNLNRHQRTPRIRFVGDGHGTGIRWERR